MELILKPKPRGLGGASPFPSDGAYSLLLSEKEHWKSKCFQLVGAVGAFTPQPARSFTPSFPAPSQHSWGWTPSGSWGPPQAPHPSLHCPAQPLSFADRATQVGVGDFDMGAPTSSTVGTTTSPDIFAAPPRVRRSLFVAPLCASEPATSPASPHMATVLSSMQSTLALLVSSIGTLTQREARELAVTSPVALPVGTASAGAAAISVDASTPAQAGADLHTSADDSTILKWN